MASEASNRGHSTPRPGRRTKEVPPATTLPRSAVSGGVEGVPGGSAPCEVVQPGLEAREPAAIGWAYEEPPQLSDGSLGTGSATYRVVISCVFDRRESGSSE